MTLVLALRELWRRRVLTVLALLPAIVAGVAIPYRLGLPLKPRQHQIGVGSASAFVDSTQSQVANLGQTGSDIGTLAVRASLLASLMANSPIKDDIARRAGLPGKNLTTSAPGLPAASLSGAPAVSAAATPSPRAAVLSISIPTIPAGQLPIIQVSTQASTAAAAAKLADAAFAALQADVSAVATTDQVPALQRLVIRQLGPAISGVAVRGPGLLTGILGGLAVFVLVCGVIVWLSAMASAWRQSVAVEHDPLGQPQPPAIAPGLAADSMRVHVSGAGPATLEQAASGAHGGDSRLHGRRR